MQSISSSALVVLALAIPLATFPIIRLARSRRRHKIIPPSSERVLILGATSGVGRSLAQLYTKRGSRVCIVGRRKDAADTVRTECMALSTSGANSTSENCILAIAADFTDAEDMVELRDTLSKTWGGIDTLAVVAGVSALRPILATAGVQRPTHSSDFADATVDGVKESISIANAACSGNFIGPLTAAVTFIPLLTRTSSSPSIALVSSVAAVIPAPTRALYAATKGASLLLYQALSVEHPEIAFTHILPGTIEGDFRASAVDKGPVVEVDPNKSGLKREVVAQRCIDAIDNRERTVFMGGIYRLGHLLYWIIPGFIESRAKQKYNFAIN